MGPPSAAGFPGELHIPGAGLPPGAGFAHGAQPNLLSESRALSFSGL